MLKRASLCCWQDLLLQYDATNLNSKSVHRETDWTSFRITKCFELCETSVIIDHDVKLFMVFNDGLRDPCRIVSVICQSPPTWISQMYVNHWPVISWRWQRLPCNFTHRKFYIIGRFLVVMNSTAGDWDVPATTGSNKARNEGNVCFFFLLMSLGSMGPFSGGPLYWM